MGTFGSRAYILAIFLFLTLTENSCPEFKRVLGGYSSTVIHLKQILVNEKTDIVKLLVNRVVV